MIGPLYCFRPRIAYQTSPRIVPPPKTSTDQFIDTKVTGTAGGKNEKTMDIIRNITERMLM